MQKFSISFLLLVCSLFSFSQENNEQLELVVENDKFVLKDRYYTSGLFLSYKKDLDNKFIFRKTDENKLQLQITLGNQTYTPTNLESIDVRDFDRPYAGWLFVKAEIGSIKNNSAFFIGVETGTTGEASQSGRLQTWFHNAFRIEEPTWTEEIEQKFLINLKAKYTYNKSLGEFQALNFVVEPSLGTKDIYIDNSIGYTFGRFNEFRSSSRNGFIDRTTTNELFGFVNFGYRYVAHNTLIQGSLDFNDSLFTTKKSAHIFKYNLGAVYKFKRNTIKLIYNFNTKETPDSASHSYGSINIGRNF